MSWVDLFLTADNDADARRDRFIGPVMSVQVNRLPLAVSSTGVFYTGLRYSGDPKAPAEWVPNLVAPALTSIRLHEGPTDWLMLAFPNGKCVNSTDIDQTESTAERERFHALKVGDMIRIGTNATDYTDYVEILEVVDGHQLWNGVGVSSPEEPADNMWALVSGGGPGREGGGESDSAWHGDYEGIGGAGVQADCLVAFDQSALKPLTDPAYRNPMTHIHQGDPTTFMHARRAIESNIPNAALPVGALRCVRINRTIDASTMNRDRVDHEFTHMESGSFSRVIPRNRGMVSVDGSGDRDKLFFPCYQAVRAPQHSRVQRTLSLKLPSNFRQMRAIKIRGYQMNAKRLHFIENQHEQPDDDWIAIRCRELEGSVLSNNRHADRSLHVLSAGEAINRGDGTTTLYKFDPEGLTCVQFSPVNLPQISFEFIDSRGQPADVGRMHLWVSLLGETC